MTITIKTEKWTIKVYDSNTKDWFYEVLRGTPTFRQVVYALNHIH